VKPVYRIDSFYDSSLRLWTATVKDEDGNQIGDACYGAREDFAVFDARMIIRDLEDAANQSKEDE
jgi:hypothetical protein